MKRYYLYAVRLTVLLFTLSRANNVDGQNVIHYVNNPWDLSSTIKIPDFKDSLKIMQITDSHLSIEDENESDLMKYGERMHKAYMNPHKHFSKDTSETTFQFFDDLLLKAKNKNVELLILTGDIVNFPSVVSVQYVFERLTKTGIRWLYIAGNHDWHYEGMDGVLDSLRSTWIENSLLPLYDGLNPLFYSVIINGINFVGIDNSTGQVKNEQVEFLKDQLKHHEPIILISHIPYNLNIPGMIPLNNIISSNSDKIIAILTGHIHRSSFYFTGNSCQYTALPAFQGGSFMVNIISD